MVGEDRRLFLDQVIEQIPDQDQPEGLLVGGGEALQNGDERVGIEVSKRIQIIAPQQMGDSDAGRKGRVELEIGPQCRTEIEDSNGLTLAETSEDLGEGGRVVGDRRALLPTLIAAVPPGGRGGRRRSLQPAHSGLGRAHRLRRG